MLLSLQYSASAGQPARERLWLFVSSIPAIIFVGIITYFFQLQFLYRNPLIYIVLNIVILAVFLWDAVARFRNTIFEPLPSINETDPGILKNAKARLNTIRIAGALAGDCAGLAVILGVVLFGLQFVTSAAEQRFVFGSLNYTTNLSASPIPVANLTQIPIPIVQPKDQVFLFSSLGSHTISLSTFDFIGVFVILLVLLISIAIIGAQVVVPGPGVKDVRIWLGNMRAVAGNSADQVRLSVRRVGIPLVWLLPAYMIARFSQSVAQYDNQGQIGASGAPGKLVQLFNPLDNLNTLNTYTSATASVAFATLAIAGTLLASIIYADRAIFSEVLASLRLAGRTMAMVSAPLIFGLAAINAIAIVVAPIFGMSFPDPLRVGWAGLIAVTVLILYMVYTLARDRIQHPKIPKTVTPVETPV